MLKQLAAGSVDASVDVAGFGAGRYTLPVRDRRLTTVRGRPHRSPPGASHHPMSTKLFGTDGVRGRAGEPPLDARTVRRLGMALVKALPPGDGAVRLLVGRDTRESGAQIERDLAVGATAAGAAVISAGVIPTPAVAHLTRSQGFAAGLVISASHNPFHDNGIKVFSGGGEKFTEALEAEVEAIVADDVLAGARRRRSSRPAGRRNRRVPRARPARARWDSFRATPGGSRSTARTAPPTARRPRSSGASGSRSRRSAASPTGATSTSTCGSTHPGRLAQARRRRALRSGRGLRRRRRPRDSRRCRGAHRRRRRGDAAVRQADAGRRAGSAANTVVATVMSNIGLEIALRDSRHRARALPGRRQVRDGRAAARQPVARRRAVGPRHLPGLPLHGRRHRHRAQRAAGDGGNGAAARRSRRRAEDLSAGAAQPAGAREARLDDDSRRGGRPSRTSRPDSRGGAGCSCATRAPSRSCAS